MGQLTVEQRYTIQVLKNQGFAQKMIAEQIGKNASVVCRELQRNCDNRSGEYRAELAEKKCRNRHKIKSKKIRFTSDIQFFVEVLIKENYSPEQVVGVAKIQQKSCVSTERIYQHIWAEKKSGGELYKHLRTQGKRYRKRGASKDKRGQIIGRIDIEKRPKIVEEKTRFGDLEIDLVIGKNHKKAILTANDRATGKVRIALLESKSAEKVKEKAIKILQEWKPMLFTTEVHEGMKQKTPLNALLIKVLDV